MRGGDDVAVAGVEFDDLFGDAAGLGVAPGSDMGDVVGNLCGGGVVEEVRHGDAEEAGQGFDVVDARVGLFADGALVDVGCGHCSGMVGDPCGDLAVL
jgi:hypothetical protein